MRLKEKIEYRASAKWDKESGENADTGNFHIPFDTPKEYGGNENSPCPDQLFLANLTGCLMNTLLYYKKSLGAETIDIQIDAEAEITLKHPHGYRMTGIDIIITVTSDSDNLELNLKCAERAKKFCHITRSIESAIPTKIKIDVKAR